MAIFKLSTPVQTAVLGAAILAVSAVALAETRKSDPIAISADDQKAFDNDRTLVFTGKVEALQGDHRMRADVVHVYYKPKDPNAAPVREGAQPGKGWGDPDHLVAEGHVYFVSPTQVVTGDNAVYTYDTDVLVVTGNVVATQGENVSKGDRLTVDNATGESHMDARPVTTGPKRVSAVIFPKNNTAAAPAAPGAKPATPAPATDKPH